MPTTSASPGRNAAARSSERAGRERQRLREVGEVGRRAHAHEDEVVALRDDELVDALRPLGRDEQVEAELPPLRRDLRRALGREGGDLVPGLAGADVVRLVDDDEHRIALGTAAPERGQHALRRDRLLPRSLERAEVDHEAARPSGADQILDRALVARRPDRPAVDAEVAEAGTERPPLRLRSLQQPLGDLAARRGAALEALLDEVHEDAVLLPVADRVEPQDRRLLLRLEVGEADMEPFGARRAAAADDDALGRAPVAVRNVAVHAVAKRADADEVGVRVEDDDPERRLEEKLLEHRAERVALPGAGLPAEERVPVEAARVEEEAHSVLGGELADVERRPLWPRPLPTMPPTRASSARAIATSWNGATPPSRSIPWPWTESRSSATSSTVCTCPRCSPTDA